MILDSQETLNSQETPSYIEGMIQNNENMRAYLQNYYNHGESLDMNPITISDNSNGES